MARIRTIKPEFFTSLTLARVSQPARLTFIGLWTYCDDDGRGRDEPRLVKAAVWPLDDKVTADTVDRHLVELAEAGLIQRYAVSGQRCLAVRNWKEHQKIDRPRASILPPPPSRRAEDAGAFDEPSTNPPRAVGEASSGERKGKERKGSDDARRRELTWLTPFSDAWKATRGHPPFGRLAKVLRPVVQGHGARQTLLVWTGYLEERRASGFCTPEDFASQYEFYRRKWGVEINEVGDEVPLPDEPEAAA